MQTNAKGMLWTWAWCLLCFATILPIGGCAPNETDGDASLSAGEALTVTPGAPWVARHGLSVADYQTEFNKWTAAGYRLTYVNGYSVNNQPYYAAVWQLASSAPWIARHGLTAAQYQQEFDTQLANGYHPVLVNGYTVNGVDYYAAIWEQSATPAWIARHGLTAAQYQQEFDTQLANGYRLVHVSGYGGSTEEFAAIWVKASGSVWVARHALTAAQYQQEFDARAAAGYHLVLVGGYPVIGGGTHYVAIWEQGSVVPWQARHGLNAADYQQTFNDLRYQGYQPVVVSGYGDANGPHFAALWQNHSLSPASLSNIDTYVNGVISSTGAPAVSLAITKNGRLVFAKAYGMANKSTGEAANTASLFRIASVSKPVTSAAILKLVEQRRLTLDSKVFGTGSLLGTTYGTKAYSTWLKQITVRHLLSHTGGWPNTTDPMFKDPSWSQTQVINWTLDNLPLSNQPGTAFAYSNFGYCLLGRIIEKVTGKAYGTWVQQNILSPAGVTDMLIAGNTLAARAANEVVYYDSEDSYGMNVTRMDSHGGWIATPIDLVRLAVRLDGFAPPADLLTAASESAINSGSAANSGYGLGWALNTHNVTDAPCKESAVVPCSVRWHNGSLPGTTSVLVRTSGQFTWAAITSTRQNGPDIDSMMWNIINNVSAWPTYDLF